MKERRRHGRRRVGAGQADMHFSYPPHTYNPDRSVALHHTCRPLTCATTFLESPAPSRHGDRSGIDGSEREQPRTRSGSVSSHAGADNLHRHRQSPTGHKKRRTTGTWARPSSKWLIKLLSPRCNRRASVSATPAQAALPSAGAVIGGAEPGPPRPRWCPKGTRSRPGGCRR